MESHIIPEFFYKSVYDKKHKIYCIPKSENKRIEILQKGIREKLLCKNCEQKFSIFENYAKKLIYGGRIDVKITQGAPQYTIYNDVDYKTFKLFQLSNIWRASIARKPMFADFNLGPHEEKIRQMLLTENPGKYYEYGCLIMAMTDGSEIMDIICDPRLVRVDNFRCYIFLFGGFIWFYVIAKHANKFPNKYLFASENGRLIILKEHIHNIDFLQADAKILRSRVDEYSRLAQKDARII